MILTVTPNTAVDKTYRVEGFRRDRVNRPSLTYTVAGGKGVNVARVFRTLGGVAVATGFLGGIQGRIVARALADEGTIDAFVRVRGESRLCIAIIDPTEGTQTEINESGPPISKRAIAELLRRFRRLLSQDAFEFVVLSGSLPPQTPPTIYAELIAVAHEFGVRTVLDASGDALRAGVAAAPWMVKPNQTELESLTGRSLTSLAETHEAARQLQAQGVTIVAATRGAEGALLSTPEGVWLATPPPIRFASAVASGDSFVAAFLWEWAHGATPEDPESALRLATGAGAANAEVIGAGFCTREAILGMASRAQIVQQERHPLASRQN